MVRPVSPPTMTIIEVASASRSPSSPTKAIGVLPPHVVSTDRRRRSHSITDARPGSREESATRRLIDIGGSIVASAIAASAASIIKVTGSFGVSRSGRCLTTWARPTMTGVRGGTGIRVG